MTLALVCSYCLDSHKLVRCMLTRTGPITLIILFLVSHFNVFVYFVSCGKHFKRAIFEPITNTILASAGFALTGHKIARRPKGQARDGDGQRSPSPQEVWGSAVSSPTGSGATAPAHSDFWVHFCMQMTGGYDFHQWWTSHLADLSIHLGGMCPRRRSCNLDMATMAYHYLGYG